MKISFIDLKRTHNPINDDLENSIARVIESSNYILGEEVEKFEHSFSKYIGTKHCLGCSSGTDALELTLRLFDLDSTDEVIIPANTWVSAAEVTKIIGAKAIFVDVDPDTYNIDFSDLKNKLSKNTKVVIVTHLFGNPLNIKTLKETIRPYDIKIIEDCAQAHGAEFEGKKVGGLGDVSCFSFYPTKNLGGFGDSGAVLTNSDEYNHKLRILRNHGQEDRDKHILLSRNYRMDEIQAAVLNIKLRYLDGWNKERTSISEKYIESLSGLDLLETPELKNGHIYHQFVVRVQKRNELKLLLKKEGIDTKIHYPNIIPSMKPYYEPGFEMNYKKAFDLSEKILSLPIYPRLKEREIEFICESIKSNLRSF